MTSFEIDPDDELYRRLSEQQVDWSTRKPRVNAYYKGKGPDQEISVYVKRIEPNAQKLLDDHDRSHFGMGIITVADVRDLGLEVLPQPTPGGPSHAVVVPKAHEQITKPLCDQLAIRTDIVIFPKRTH